ncbi:MAG: alanine--glyoxylate aminotransferase family protein [Proteobacteria bacterium]|nr:alanine--glyoxylate aminotransferase family protein [Pseudomonadota bacterium]
MTIDPKNFRDLDPGERVLMGPGPSNVSPRVLSALGAPCIGHLDPYFLSIMDETQALLRALFQTENQLTIPVSGTGSAGMETCFVNLVQPGDKVVIGVNGVFGTRMSDVASRLGAEVTRVEAEWGRAVDPGDIRQAALQEKPKIIALVHAETSTGVRQPIGGLRDIADECGALLLLDTVTSLGGIEVAVDKWGIDAVYSGTQKCLSCPPGLSPISLSARAMEVLKKRKTKVPNWYLDMSLVADYWGSSRKYHHTAPVNMIYALREALRLIVEEGMAARFERHLTNHQALVAGLEAMGLSMLVKPEERLPMLNAVVVPDGVDELKVRQRLLAEYGIEIGGGLGDLSGKIWRVGLMGFSCSRRNVTLFLSALERVLWA